MYSENLFEMLNFEGGFRGYVLHFFFYYIINLKRIFYWKIVPAVYPEDTNTKGVHKCSLHEYRYTDIMMLQREKIPKSRVVVDIFLEKVTIFLIIV